MAGVRCRPEGPPGGRAAAWAAGAIVAAVVAVAAVGVASYALDAHAVALTVTAPADRTLEAHSKQTVARLVRYGQATAESNSTAPIIITNDAPERFPVGTTTITWTARQGTEVAVDTQRITMQDTRPPRIDRTDCKTFEATGPLTQLSQGDYNVPNVIDVSDIRSLTNNAPPAGFPLGVTNLTWTAVDAQGHSASKTFCGAYVVDTTSPSLTVPPPYVIKAVSALTPLTSQFGKASATDAVTTSPTIRNNAPDKFPVGITVITWNATDGAGNHSSATQQIRIVDAEAPALTIPSTRIVEATGATTMPTQNDLGTATATDNVDPSPKISNDLTGSIGLGANRVLWTATDKSGNSSWKTQVVAIVDTTPPEVTAPADVLIDSATPVALSSVVIGAATAVDLVDGAVTPTSDAPSTLPLGTTTVTWSAADARGASSSAAQEITVVPSRILRTIQPPSPSEPWAHGFGHKLARSGDLLLVSNTLHAKDGMARAGAVHVYGVADGALDRTLHYSATAQRANQYFGGSIAAVDGGQVAVGARGYDASGRFAGSVQVFNPATGAHVRTIDNPSATSSGGGTGDSFGAFTASLGDKLAVAAHKHDAPGASDVGRVYIYNVSNGALLWTLENPDPDAGDQFGRRLAAFEDAKGEHVYVGSRDDGGKKGAVYAFKVGSTTPAWKATALPGTANTRYAYEAIVPDGEGGVFVGESYIRSGVTWEGKVRHYGPGGTLLGSVDPDACCSRDFGSRLAVANGLLYAGDRYAVGGGSITAHDAADRKLAGSFGNPAASSTHFGFALEPLGGALLAASEHSSSATRVHVLDLPSITGIRPSPASGASGASGAAGAAAPAPPALFEPTLVSTAFGDGTVTLTYDAELDPFEVGIDDYELGGGLTIVSATAVGKTVTVEHIGSTAGAAGASGPAVEMVGDIGLYERRGGAD